MTLVNPGNTMIFSISPSVAAAAADTAAGQFLRNNPAGGKPAQYDTQHEDIESSPDRHRAT